MTVAVAAPAPLSNPGWPDILPGYVGPSPADFTAFRDMAELLAGARTAVPLPYQHRTGDMAALMLRAHDLNIPIGVALDHLYVVPGGRTAMTAYLMGALLIERHRITIKIKTLTDQECELHFTRGRKKLSTSRYTIREAAALKLTRFRWWQAVPEDCLYARAMSRACRRPPLQGLIVLGCYVREEVYEAMARGEALDGEQIAVEVDAEVAEWLDAAAAATDPDDVRVKLRDQARKAKKHRLVMPDGRTVDDHLIEAWHHTVTRHHAARAEAALAAGTAEPGTEPTPPRCTCDPVAVARAGRHEDGCDERAHVPA
jgi:hypothetical protein